MYANLPTKFAKVAERLHGWSIAVDHNGTLRVQELSDPDNTRFEGAGRRWSYLPWTKEQDASCQPIKIKLVYWNTAMNEKTKEEEELVEGQVT
jgi:hypothetical protein